MMVESALIISMEELISMTKGNPASVDFDFEAVWEHKRKTGPSFNPEYLKWVHVHPSGFGTTPSETDQRCAEALAAAFGCVRSFGIICFSNPTFLDLGGRISWYEWRGPKGRLVKTEERGLCDDTILIEDEIFALKALSYGDNWRSKE